MKKFVFRILINGVALYAAIQLVDGLEMQNPSWLSYVWLALIFGIVNALIRPIAKALSCGLIAITLGLFTLLINTAMLYVTSYVGGLFEYGMSISNFMAAFIGALIISVVSFILNMIFKDELKGRR